MCSYRKCQYSPREGGGWGSQRPKNLSKYMKLDWNFQRGGGGGGGGGGGVYKGKTPSVAEVWLIFGTKKY